MAGVLRRPRRPAQRGLAAVPARVHVEPRKLVWDPGVSGAWPARRVTLGKQRLGLAPAPEHLPGPNSPEGWTCSFPLYDGEVGGDFADAVGKHRLPPSGCSHANLFPAPDRNRLVRAARGQ
jgi:hypothetical protein